MLIYYFYYNKVCLTFVCVMQSLLFQLFDKISKEKKGKVKVFFCGAPQLGKIIKNTFLKKSSENTQTFQ